MTEQIHNKSSPEIIADTLIGEEITHVEQIAWVLLVEGGDNFSGAGNFRVIPREDRSSRYRPTGAACRG
jgi:hypothetical protein